ncbi:Nucleoside-diphosphate-sugar epimerase [Anaerocolumna jejuensis DSM 15929]|uniref:Nucleoside-diphosphate-sugar epimerase n=1 Tax=Anaerocolumna jejuensis DSM 15929 TaxID=1121322 RepID=A0A1M6JPX3_9FIRM|nr:NAD-dependent epimerase/dehydratase family protein [Anaerocolumna jejuensis]SHJ48777.1 Nucleoside-diphosphate-sugar epimerase [Anaerocolumna jejuensis DSM 15929]
MNILVTGAGGFVGRHISSALKNIPGIVVYESFHGTKKEELVSYLERSDFIYHLAGVNRSGNLEDFTEGNVRVTEEITEALADLKNPCGILYASSIHALLPTPYGRSKRAAEEVLKAYEVNLGGRVYIYRLTNLFGEGARPNYNSVIATFCYNIAKGLPITVHDRNTVLNLCHIDDVVREFLKVLNEEGHKGEDGFYCIPKVYQVSLGALADSLLAFQNNTAEEEKLSEFEKALYHTFLSYRKECSGSEVIYENSAD